MTKSISINDIQFIIGGTIITSLAEGENLNYSIPQRTSSYTDAHGKSYFNQNKNSDVTITLKLGATSQSNNYLTQLYNLGTAGIVPATFTDFSSDTRISSLSACVNLEDGALYSNNSDRVVTWSIIMVEASVVINGIKERG